MPSPLTFRRKLLLLIALVLLAFALGACRKQKDIVSTSTETEVRSSSGVTPRDTLVTLPGAMVATTVRVDTLYLPAQTVRSDRAWSTVSIANGELHHAGGCDTTELRMTLYDKWSKEQARSASTAQKVTTVTVTVIPKWVWWALGFGLAGLLRLTWQLWRRLIL